MVVNFFPGYCPSGSEKNGTVCHPCLIGYFKDNSEDVFGNCTRCRNSSYVTAGIESISDANCTVCEYICVVLSFHKI